MPLVAVSWEQERANRRQPPFQHHLHPTSQHQRRSCSYHRLHRGSDSARALRGRLLLFPGGERVDARSLTVAHDPLIDRDFAPAYYTQTDAQAIYYNAIQDVLVAHKVLALPAADRARIDPLMSAINLKDARAGEYIKKMVRLYPGVWSGFGEIIFKKQEVSEKMAGGPPSLYSPSIDAIFDVMGAMGAAAVVHCDHDTPYNLALLSDSAATAMIFHGKKPTPQYMGAFQAFLKKHPDVHIV